MAWAQSSIASIPSIGASYEYPLESEENPEEKIENF